MKKFYIGSRSIMLYEEGDQEIKPHYEDGKLGGLYLCSCGGGIRIIRKTLENHAIPYENLTDCSLFIKNANRSEIDAIHELVRVNRLNHAFGIVNSGFEESVLKARSLGDSRIFIDREKTQERHFVNFEISNNWARVCKPKTKQEVVRILSIPASNIKKETKTRIGEIHAQEERSILLVDPDNLKCFTFKNEDESHLVTLEKGDYTLYKISDQDGKIVGMTIDKTA